jgi:phosphoribosylcarboxyaminoimidazole (NCAIR) mutase
MGLVAWPHPPLPVVGAPIEAQQMDGRDAVRTRCGGRGPIGTWLRGTATHSRLACH